MKISNKGQSLIEVMLAISILAIVLPALITGFVNSRDAKPQNKKRSEAYFLLVETIDATKSARASNWSNIGTSGTYYPTLISNEWALTSGTQIVGDYTRHVVIEDVYRDTNLDIVESGGVLDDSTKKVTAYVTWTTPRNGQINTSTYLTRHIGNTTWGQSTESDFNSGTTSATTVTNNSGGEIELEYQSGGSWASASEVGNYNNSGSTDAQSIWIEGIYAYLGMVSGSGDDFVILDISAPSSPTNVGGMDIGATVYEIYISGNYAYLATSSNSEELKVIDISTPDSPSQVGSLNLGDGRDAYSIYGSENYVYVGKDSAGGGNREIYAVDITTPSSPTEVGNVEVGADVNDLYIKDNYLFAATDGSELIIYDISTPSSITTLASYNSSGGANGEAIYIEGDYAYLGTVNNASSEEFEVIDISNLSSPTLVGALEVGDTVNSISVSGDYAVISTNENTKDIIVVDISDKSNPSESTFLNNGGDANDVFILGDYAFIASEDNSKELIVLEGGSGSGYMSSGSFTSSTFDTGSEVAFNFLSFSSTEPASTSLNVQYAINNDNLTWNYIGPDGTNATYFEGTSSIPLGNILGRYFKYRVYLSTTNSEQTPVFEDFVVNYSP